MELFFELYQIVGRCMDRYPHLGAHLRHYPRPRLNYGFDASIETFKDFLIHLHRSNVPYFRDRFRVVYNGDNQAHNHGFTFLALVRALRAAGIREEGDVLHISFSPFIHYHLRALQREEIQVLPKDNPGLTSLEELATDYPLHTLSAITPNTIPPHEIVSSIRAIQSIPDGLFRSLYVSCVHPSFLSQDLEFSSIRNGFETWKQFWPAGVDIFEAAHVLITLAEQYVGPISVGAITVRPNGRYTMTPDLRAFVSEERVPDFIRSQGSFASALCVLPSLHTIRFCMTATVASIRFS